MSLHVDPIISTFLFASRLALCAADILALVSAVIFLRYGEGQIRFDRGIETCCQSKTRMVKTNSQNTVTLT